MTTQGVGFEVIGTAQPQGNKTAYVHGGRAVLVEGRRAPARAAFKAWRDNITTRALAAMEGTSPIHGPVELDIRFFFTRPLSHYGTGRNSRIVKAAAPNAHTVKPDLDKLVRAIGDAITSVVILDDSQIARIVAAKVYTEGDPHASVRVRPIVSLDQILGRAA